MSSEFPLAHTVGWHSWQGEGEDDHGNVVDIYSPPLDQPGTPRQVIGWQVLSAAEVVLAGHDRAAVVVDLGVPAGFTLDRRDVVDLPYGPAGQYQVDGPVRSAEGNPFGWTWPGLVTLRRVEG
ncbi:hypothetical protein IU454_08005 [Nocardia farcinica]|uniref:hypothetical protein n=1 Tax=Nocardia farcinica TaxID=37329 RepID=UPI001894965C|nr:hypothetical protein [Nocardia farcinica]MBF6291806.1 hypothetical protein [Nocardia farcinica]